MAPKRQTSSKTSKKTSSAWKGFLPKNAIVMARAGARKGGAKTTSQAREKLEASAAAVAHAAKSAPKAAAKSLGDTLETVAKELKLFRLKNKFDLSDNVVLGEGNPNAAIVFVGEAPGEQEDLQGRPFIGRAGQLLEKMIEAMGLSREQVYITNVVKSRPPENRTPAPDEIEAWRPYLNRELAIIKPKVIVALGKTAVQGLLKSDAKMSSLRGSFQDYEGIKLMPTWHPAYLLRNPPAKKDTWEDLKIVAKEVGIKIPKRTASAGA